MAWPGLPGTKKSRWQQSPSPKMAASVDDSVVQGTKAKWRISLLLPVMWWRERTKLKMNNTAIKLPQSQNSLFLQTANNREQGQKQRKPGVQNQSSATKIFAPYHPTGPLPAVPALNPQCQFLCHFLAHWTQLVLRCSSESLPRCGARWGEGAPQGTKTSSPDTASPG